MNILAIFLVLGVGADDIFVLVDSWKQSRVDVKPREVSEREGGGEMKLKLSRFSLSLYIPTVGITHAHSTQYYRHTAHILWVAAHCILWGLLDDVY